MANINELISERNQYQALQANLKDLADKLKKCIDEITPATGIQNYFRVDDESPENNVIKHYQNQLIQQREMILSNVIIGIEEKVGQLNFQIEQEQKRLEEERRREEARKNETYVD